MEAISRKGRADTKAKGKTKLSFENAQSLHGKKLRIVLKQNNQEDYQPVSAIICKSSMRLHLTAQLLYDLAIFT
jgi:hypothetical protein